ncbi:DUF5719 family protein [Microbacterium hominis]|uniref:DUF5719 family protein n=1 Tax=Microbacterium hominis TaxID=162426 RepID=UPI001F0671CA|nr:DUF5719 family protein [Microbacterium hominis]
MSDGVSHARGPRGIAGVRLAVGGAVAAVAIAAAVALVVTPLPTLAREAVTVTAHTPASASVATCVGPILATGRDASIASQLTDAAPAAVTSAAASAGTPAAATTSTLLTPDVTGGTGPTTLRAAPVGGEPTDIAAASAARAAAEDLSGFAAAACARPEMESWLVAGSAATGASDLVVLSNPGAVAARVTVTVYGADGGAVPVAGNGIVVPAGTQRVIPLASLAIGEENPVLRITSSQAPVRAALQASLTRVLVAGGVDQVGAAAVPDTDLVIPGVPVVTTQGGAGESNVPTALRLLSPGSDAQATVTVFQGATQVGTAQTVPLTAGVPLKLDLGGLATGTYAVRVSATAPVTGAVWATSGFGAGSDFGWFVAAEEISAPALVAVAAGGSGAPEPTLTLASSDGRATTVVLTAAAGAGTATDVTVPASGAVTVPVRPGEVYRVDPGTGAVRAGVTYAGASALAGYPVAPSAAAASAVTVYPR